MLKNAEEAGKRLQPILEGLGNVIIGGEYPVSVSIGIAMVTDGDAEHDELYRRADLALYRSKHAGKNTYNVYEAEVDK